MDENQKPIEPAKPFVVMVEGIPHIAIPNGFSIKSAEGILSSPARDRRIVSVVDVDSFKTYLDIHKTERVAVHVNVLWPTSDHKKELACGYCDDGNSSTTSWRDHEVRLSPVLSQDFEDWKTIDGEELSQLDLVRFLDKHLSNITKPEEDNTSPSAAEVMTFVSNLSDVRRVEFKKSVNLDNGRVQLSYNEIDESGSSANITIPKSFWVRLKPIVGHPAEYKIRVTLRYRIKDMTNLIFTLEMRDLQSLLEAIREEIIKDLCEKIAPVPVFLTE